MELDAVEHHLYTLTSPPPPISDNYWVRPTDPASIAAADFEWKERCAYYRRHGKG
jgi:hypothetical protein